MKTDDLIGMLARQAGPVEPPGDVRQLAWGLALALPPMLAAVAGVLGFVPPDLWAASATGPKLVYALALCGVSWWLLRRIGQPGASTTVPVAALAAVLAVAFAIAVTDVLRLPSDLRLAEMMGGSARRCPVAILILSLPALLAALASARRLAPTDLRRAGLAAGLLAGGLGAAAYALACTEGSLAFVAIWYTLGMCLGGVLGSAVGPRVLRW